MNSEEYDPAVTSYELILECLRTLVWPTAGLVVLWWYRQPLGGFIGRAYSLFARFGSKAEFSIQAAAAKAEADSKELDKAPENIDAGAEMVVTATLSAEAEVTHAEATDEAHFDEHATVLVVDAGPGVDAAAALTDLERLEVENRLIRTRLFSRHQPDEEWFQNLSTNPSAAMISIGEELLRAVAGPEANIVARPALWPGTPENVAALFEQLHTLWIEARLEPEEVPRRAAWLYESAARRWAGAYVDFVEDALKAADGLPLSYREQLKAEPEN